ncbi:GNAT family N-acetyltransferase [Micromonospora sp. C51]|uniref:GNAT family N-acetyltransferase n=1 Tax=Micromonospora sp. C51 TaxID=2824879 RepID=UPI001B38ADEF|nr:GNAT family N-acetyltransferase [Micromonospora sp. C51]MBQ1048185.1 GNAT family N-acetyltransferase [Micromonospora sp. C51]
MSPLGWVGIVALGDAAIVTVPADSWAGTVREVLRGIPVGVLTDSDRLRAVLPVAEVLGPASLAYLDEGDFQPVGLDTVDVVPGGHADLVRLLASVPVDDADECGLADITSAAFVVRCGNHVVAAAGYRCWPGMVAHMCVLTRPDQRERGLARAVASAAAADGLANRLLPQWRARPEPSRRVARALGFRQLGTQLSIRIGT